MGLIIGNRGLQGSPNLPYLQDTTLAGEDTYVNYTFLDRVNVPVVPSTISVELDDLTNSLNMDGGPNPLNPAGATSTNYIYQPFSAGANGPWVLQATAAVMQMTYPYQGSQICKLKLIWTAVDSVYGNPFTGIFENVIELVSSPTVSGGI
ncbi:MAG: hypothetical protein ACREHV_14470 [Rhizomicrobium sp.]